MTTTDTTRPADALDLLMDEHRQGEMILRELREAGSPQHKRELVELLITHLVRHAVAEETYIHPLVRAHLPDGEDAVQHDLVDHQDLEQMLEQLQDADPNGALFRVTVEEMQSVLSDHIADEEAEQFPSLRKVVPADQLVDLRPKLEAIERMAPTRPHPGAPGDEPLDRLAGPGVGLIDRIKDALSGGIPHESVDPV